MTSSILEAGCRTAGSDPRFGQTDLGQSLHNITLLVGAGMFGALTPIIDNN
tara:strand:+ start:198 stop:350 length:153 start_codon:yes stop_codon:yes gene_type:complete